jgi:hypothetical protein
MFRVLLVVIGACALVGCATAPRFEWGNYERSLYMYAKHPEAREAYRKTLVVAIQKGEQSKRLAPGLYAELGYLSLEDGNQTEAVSDFKKEMAAFPESRPFLGGVIERIGAGQGATLTAKKPSAPTGASPDTPTS